MSVVARVWFGKTVSVSHREYLEYVNQTGVSALRKTPGNRGVLVLSRMDPKESEIGVISYWDSREAIRGFAGPDINRAVYYPEDAKHLLTMEPYLLHYDLPVIEGVHFDGAVNKKNG